MATLQNFRSVSGDDITIAVAVTDSAGAAVNITGASIRWSARKLTDASNAIEKTTAAGGVVITSATGGLFEVRLVPADTASLEGVFHHESELTDLSGRVSTVAVGSMTLSDDVAV